MNREGQVWARWDGDLCLILGRGIRGYGPRTWSVLWLVEARTQDLMEDTFTAAENLDPTKWHAGTGWRRVQ